MTGGNRWVSSVLGTSGQGRHTKSAQGEVLARHGPENDDECPRLSKVPYFQSQTPDTPVGAHSLYRAIGPGTHRLHVHGSNGRCKRETCCEKCLGHQRPLHTLHPGMSPTITSCALRTCPLQQEGPGRRDAPL